MRIGVLGVAVSSGGTIGGATAPPITGTIVSSDNNSGIIPGTQLSNGYTSGPSVTGDTLVCPPGYPYDYTIHDCSGYAGSPADKAALELQASIDVCISGGGMWDGAKCVSPVNAHANQLISGIDNTVLYATGGILLLMIFMGARR